MSKVSVAPFNTEGICNVVGHVDCSDVEVWDCDELKVLSSVLRTGESGEGCTGSLERIVTN